jgi:hypothetical protein
VEGGTRSASGLLTGPATTQNFQELLDLARRYCAKHPLRKSNPVTGFVLEGGAVRASPQSLLPLVDRRLFESLTGTQFFENPCFLEFLLETLEGLVDGFVVFDVNFEHT